MKKIFDEDVIYKFEPDMEPVSQIEPGELVEFETRDCFSGQIKDEEKTMEEIDMSKSNPATGPLKVKGAEPGDFLKVDILDITLPDWGVTAIAPGEGVLGDKIDTAETVIPEIRGDVCYFDGVKISLNPMVGIIGVAPEEETFSSWSQGRHGGNLDTVDICKGSSVYLPVKQDGGLLALGDCHGSMGDGEVCVTGLEISSDVLTRVDIVDGPGIDWPVVSKEDKLAVMCSSGTVDEAIEKSVSSAVEILSENRDLEYEKAYMISSLSVDFRISQVVNPKVTVRASIPKEILDAESIFD